MIPSAQTWSHVLDAIAEEVPDWSFETWFRQVRFTSYHGGRLELGVPNLFIRRWLVKKYRGTILRAVESVWKVVPRKLVISICGELYREMRAQQSRQAQRVAAGAMMASVGVGGPEPEQTGPDSSGADSADFSSQPLKEKGPVGEGRSLHGQRSAYQAERGGQSGAFAPSDRPGPYPRSRRPGLNNEFRLRNLVVGSCNRLAHAASLAVIEQPASAYNPLFIYGAPGLGKTHLLQGICHAMLDRDYPGSVQYVSCEAFVNEFLRALHARQLDAFRQRYRSVDVLVIDDIQFLAGKDRTQDEFFHTFETLHNLGRQIVLSAGDHPKGIDGIKDKLVTRFVSGLVASVEAPSFQVRLDILKINCRSRSWRVPDEALSLIARRMETNVRELEGALAKVVALSAVENCAPDITLTHAALKGLSLTREGPVTLEEILRAVVQYYGVPETEVCSKKREKRVLIPRQVAMYLAKSLTEASFQTIGNAYGGRNHATVLHANRKIGLQIKTDPAMRQSIEAIRRALRA